ncbi:homeobox KN domain-containing protein [Trichoderma breve]|uniref:Homeobox KN domain-containing protein n=1 Tax=Trichoderma breve TaxID=2034170 RepID=A0A9W9JTD2_9HYPO|nr:homeobox KN domain-containing protein [Trichoderma breve]KAJ4865652.1 homeobox KN domain-containing protein [Trichoderma breve]
MSGADCEFVELHDAPDSDTCPASGQTDHTTSLHQDDPTEHSISTQLLNQTVSEQPYESATTDQSMNQDNLSDDFWGLRHPAMAAPCASEAVAGSSAHSSVTHVPQPSQHNSGAADESIAQENPASLTYDFFTTPSPLPYTGWESGPQSAGSDHGNTHSNSVNPPKIGSRFSRESSKLLKQWFSNHYHYPYPSKEEMKMLQRQTGLSKTQISNWLSNTRRREKMHHSTQRPDTPTVQTRRNYRTMGPLERWVDSPPESEPATVTAIANAVQCAESSHYDESGQSINESSDNSYRTSSGSSLASAYSYGSSDSVAGDSWGDRVEHLADHFKMGKTMASWTGDWGFEDVITDTLENAIPPYLLGEESTSMFPFEASDVSPESPRSAYELLVVELSSFVETYQYKTGQLPSHDAMHIEACRIIFASEMLTLEVDAEPSWLRDLVLSNEMIATQAQFLPIRTPSEGRLRTLEIRGKKSLFEECPLEAQLYNFAFTEAMVNQAVISDATLHTEACKILTRMQQALKLPLTDFVFTWFMTLLYSSPMNWLSQFRQRSSLPITESGGISLSTTLSGHWTLGTTSRTIHSHLYIDTHDFGALQQSNGEATLGAGHYAKASPSESHFIGLKHTPANVGTGIPSSPQSFMPTMFPMKHADVGSRRQPDDLLKGAYMFHDPNFHKWLGRELGRWVKSIMSPNNPNSHVPSDKEIQHHARFLVYDDGDPWNQTVADNLEWLHRFKVSVGIIPE